MVLVALLAVAVPAGAHTELASSDPVDGGTVDGPVDTVTLTFSRNIELAGKGVEVLDATGEVVTTDADVAGAVVTVEPVQPLGAGPYGVRWAVRSGDAHPVRDTFAFTVAGPASRRSIGRSIVRRGAGRRRRYRRRG